VPAGAKIVRAVNRTNKVALVAVPAANGENAPLAAPGTFGAPARWLFEHQGENR